MQALAPFLRYALERLAAAVPATSDEEPVGDCCQASGMHRHPATARGLTDRLDMVFRPALHGDPVTPAQRALHAAATDATGIGTDALLALLRHMETEGGLLLRLLAVVPVRPTLACLVPVFQLVGAPAATPFAQEMPALAFAFFFDTAAPGLPLQVVLRSYDASDTHWATARGTPDDPRLPVWPGPDRRARFRWQGTSVAWVDAHCHLYPPRPDPSGTTLTPSFQPTHHWPLAPANTATS